MYRLGFTLFGTANKYGTVRVSGSLIPAGSIGTVLAIGYCSFFQGRQVKSISFCTAAQFTPGEALRRQGRELHSCSVRVRLLSLPV